MEIEKETCKEHGNRKREPVNNMEIKKRQPVNSMEIKKGSL